jgi:hypothetical protein
MPQCGNRLPLMPAPRAIPFGPALSSNRLFDEVPEGVLRCSLMFAVNRRLCCRGLTALVNWLVFRNQYNPIAGPDGLTTQIRKEQKRSGFAGHLHTRWSRVKNHENHAHLAKPPPFNVAVPWQARFYSCRAGYFSLCCSSKERM